MRNEFAEAEPYLLTLLKERELADPNYLAYGAFALVLIYRWQGREAEAAEIVRAMDTYLQEIEHKLVQVLAESLKAELAIRQGNAAEARRLSRRAGSRAHPPRWYFYALQLTQPKLLLAERTPESLADARTLLDAINVEMVGLHIDNTRIDVLALLALVLDALGQEAEALDRLSAALHLAQAGGFIRNFVDPGLPMANLLARLRHQQGAVSSTMLPYLSRILAAFPARDGAGSRARPHGGMPGLTLDRRIASLSSLAEPLTEREVQILKFLATELSPQEMANHLSLSEATVRTHMRNIYSKLDVHSRFEAVQRAQELDMS